MTQRIWHVGTRGSRLARAQSERVISRLHEQFEQDRFIIKIIQTSGDRLADLDLSKKEGKGFFTKELEQALQDGEIDLAVHSLKDLPVDDTPGFLIAAVLRRDDPRDALVGGNGATLASLAAGRTIGTSSPRRRAQVLHARPDLSVTFLRGNVDTRLRRVKEGVVGAALLAACGLERLGLSQVVSEYLDPQKFLPAPGQGALAIQIRRDDNLARELLAPIHDPQTAAAVGAERAFLQAMGGGCHLPLGAFATVANGRVTLTGGVFSPDGRQVLKDQVSGPVEQAALRELGQELGDRLIARGAGEILKEVS